MSDAVHRVEKVKQVIADLALPEWQRLAKGLDALNGVNMPQPGSASREAFETELIAINKVLQKWNCQTADEYSQISEQDARKAFDSLAAAANHLLDSELARIFRELDCDDPQIRLRATDEVRQHREIVVPRLIQEFRDKLRAASEPDAEIGHLPIMALLIFSELDTREALPAILAAISLPEKTLEAAFSDSLSDYLPSILAQFLGDQPDELEALTANTNLSDEVRAAAIASFIHLVRDERVTRDDFVWRLDKLLRLVIAECNSYLVSLSVFQLSQFAAVECRDLVESAFEDELVDEAFFDRKSILSGLEGGDKRVQLTLSKCPPTRIARVDDELRSEPPKRENTDNVVEVIRSTLAMMMAPEPSTPRATSRPTGFEQPIAPKTTTVRLTSPERVGRNDPCPCGSGKKFKKCCGGN
ncbi:MAG: DUF1186 domain-containing protein [Pirellulales bacterium]